jgi:hypothetical protein
MNPAHANFPTPRLWEAEGEIGIDDGTKCGCRILTTLREVPLPEVTVHQRVRFAILCAKTVCTDQTWSTWADHWLSGEGRSAADAAAANAAASAAFAAAAAAANAAASAAFAAASPPPPPPTPTPPTSTPPTPPPRASR